MNERVRCAWCGSDPLYVAYHDEEWGTPCHDDRILFEFLLLEGAQAGLSWISILRRREAYRDAFAGFDPERVARFGEHDVERLMRNEKIIRNRQKIESASRNARAFLDVQAHFGSFDTYLWGFVDGVPIKTDKRQGDAFPVKTGISENMSKDLRKRGFSFVGPVICYSYMQAVGLVDDHVRECWRY